MDIVSFGIYLINSVVIDNFLRVWLMMMAKLETCNVIFLNAGTIFFV